MTEKMRSCVMGLILGQFSSPLPMAKKEPVAYLYNGVRLPKLPEWDRETYPYVFMIDGGFAYFVNALTDANYIIADDGTWEIVVGFKHLSIYCTKNGNWSGWNVITNTETGSISINKAIWANFDVLNEDGSVYVAASEPIPVYE